MRVLWILGLVLILASCKITRKTTSAASGYANYQENLKPSLPVYPDYRAQMSANPSLIESSASTEAIDDQLSQVQTRLISKNKSEPYFSGFSVLVYSGIDREKAFKTRDELAMNFPDLAPEMQYEQPRYLVKVGKYAHKIEAQKSFSEVKAQFPTARIIQDRFQREEFKTVNELN
ncbi:hypothetical protein LV84_01576 [Algoriphagus ratkowskyi]|uniref:Sporulation related protein n=1 Tax=Algoriphagus ratkowskyi TaxID=57028 RepID=A0A2W7RBR9_9BACT|nr:hypothetical protein [Algoriphagus ratkowskyi]PZX58368.1 hypothetical protein LV84_01576 [Algoriphagus ratkowskyi]TXD77763.1 hypothetical protein ESW18_10340 [Algoriphagus ratkowskyi]